MEWGCLRESEQKELFESVERELKKAAKREEELSKALEVMSSDKRWYHQAYVDSLDSMERLKEKIAELTESNALTACTLDKAQAAVALGKALVEKENAVAAVALEKAEAVAVLEKAHESERQRDAAALEALQKENTKLMDALAAATLEKADAVATLEKALAETETLKAAATLEKADAVAPLEKAGKKDFQCKERESLT